MSQSLSRLYVHLIFSTNSRKPLIRDTIRDELHAYMAGIFKNNDSPALIINSVPDHIHILFRQSKNVALTGVVEHVKKTSSRWMKEKAGIPSFSWQRGYGAFSVSGSKVETIRRYIAKQKGHHQKVDFREEIEIFMQKYDVSEYHPDYFWD